MAPAALSLDAFSYRFTVAADAPLELPGFWGDLVRSTWGAALRELACATSAPTCEGCPLSRACLYRALFDPVVPAGHKLERTQSMPAPYVIHVPPSGFRKLSAGQTFRFGMTLLGASHRHFPIARLALERALAKGWMKHRVPLSLCGVERQEAGKWLVQDPADDGATAPLASASLAPPAHLEGTRVLSVELLTPCRLQVDGRVLNPGQISPRAWLMALARRVSHLTQAYGTGANALRLSALAEAAQSSKFNHADLRWRDWHRYSSRQQRVMPMGGIVGRVQLTGPLAGFMPLLELGQRINIGKHASFGLGAYRHRELPATEAHARA